MDFRFSPAEEAFRSEVKDFLNTELGPYEGPSGDNVVAADDIWEFALSFSKKLAKRGWICPAWPKEYGGAGMPIMQQLVFNEEMALAGAPLVNNAGTNQA